jgi:hypothetical protein
MYEYILGVETSYADGSLVQGEDPNRQEEAVALLSCRLERGGGIPVPMAWGCNSAARTFASAG